METKIIDNFDVPEYLTTEEVAKLYPIVTGKLLFVKKGVCFLGFLQGVQVFIAYRE